MKTIMTSLLALLLTGAVTAGAQDRLETSLGTDIVSHYVWRGQDLGGVSVQPTLGIGYKGLSLSAWGSVGMSNPLDTQEFDLTLAYSAGGFNIGVTDYWFDCSSYVFEANVGYDFGFASLQWYTNFAGDDSLTETGKPAYSSYAEVNVPFTLGGVDWTVTAGAVPFATDFYGTDGFAFINLALTAAKDIKVTDTFSIPMFTQVAFNPCIKAAYLVVGITLQP